jgi:hypothetical protein
MEWKAQIYFINARSESISPMMSSSRRMVPALTGPIGPPRRATDGQAAYFSTRSPTCGNAASTFMTALPRTACYAAAVATVP